MKSKRAPVRCAFCPWRVVAVTRSAATSARDTHMYQRHPEQLRASNEKAIQALLARSTKEA